jgi:hypothetical protein
LRFGGVQKNLHEQKKKLQLLTLNGESEALPWLSKTSGPVS